MIIVEVNLYYCYIFSESIGRVRVGYEIGLDILVVIFADVDMFCFFLVLFIYFGYCYGCMFKFLQALFLFGQILLQLLFGGKCWGWDREGNVGVSLYYLCCGVLINYFLVVCGFCFDFSKYFFRVQSIFGLVFLFVIIFV